jgi:hypothetical protein
MFPDLVTSGYTGDICQNNLQASPFSPAPLGYIGAPAPFFPRKIKVLYKINFFVF